MLVKDITYVQALKSIREVVLDVGLVHSFKVSGQDLIFKKTDDVITIGDKDIDFKSDEAFKNLYSLFGLLVEKGVEVEILPDYVATEFISGLNNFDITIEKTGEPKTIYSKNYFTTDTIELVVIDFFDRYVYFDGVERTTEQIFNTLSYIMKRKLILWVSFYLIDKRRMQMASTKFLINRANGDSCGGELKNKNIDVTVRVGEVYTENERTEEDGNGLKGFTSLWGDKYNYFTKLQLYIRSRFEKMFNDYSLRDDAMITQSFTLEKHWQGDAWVDTLGWSDDTYGAIIEDR